MDGPRDGHLNGWTDGCLDAGVCNEHLEAEASKLKEIQIVNAAIGQMLVENNLSPSYLRPQKL